MVILPVHGNPLIRTIGAPTSFFMPSSCGREPFESLFNDEMLVLLELEDDCMNDCVPAFGCDLCASEFELDLVEDGSCCLSAGGGEFNMDRIGAVILTVEKLPRTMLGIVHDILKLFVM